LPVTNAAAAHTEESPPTVLLVDDDRLILATLAHGLRESGFRTIEAASGADALRLCAEHPPSVAIIDYDLPGMTGLQIAKALQPGASFPMIFLSAYGDDRIVSAAVNLGAMAYLVKPVDPTRLVPTIRAVLQRYSELAALRGESAQLSLALKTTRATSVVVGLLMERLQLSEQQAYERLRHYCRSQNLKVTDVATDILGATDRLHSVVAGISKTPAAAKAK
jgi:two-component system, response regulator PdtaR